MSAAKRERVITEILHPVQRFFKIEASGGIVLLIATIIALFWANSPWSDTYHHIWENKLGLTVGGFGIYKTLHHWINDGLMAIFFFVVGLEIKREILVGELSSMKNASLPIAAAIGGMVVPAAFFAILNRNPETASGWGVPMATDIAFSLGVLSLLGKRVPLSLKVFLVAFAIVDDLGAVLVIAFFYSHDLQVNYLLYGFAVYLILIVFNRLHIRSIHPYMALGWVIWYLFLKSGIHPTIAGVLIAFTIPATRKIQLNVFRNRMNSDLNQFCSDGSKDKVTLTHRQLAAIDDMFVEMRRVRSPLQGLEHRLHGFVTYIVMPIFALANAGVVMTHLNFSELFNGLTVNIELSLFVGKVTGILLFSFIAVKLGLAYLPQGVKWVQLMGLGLLGGIGFTMSLFITSLAFEDITFINPAKIGILVGSLVSGITGFFILKATLPKDADNDKNPNL